MAVAKKCKHCGEWLDGRDKQPTNTSKTPMQPTHTTTPNNGSKDYYKYTYIVLGVIAATVLVYLLASNQGQQEPLAPSEADISYSTNSTQPASTLEVESETQELEPETDREDKLSEAILNIASDGSTVIATSEEKVYYLIDSSSENVYDSDGANCGKICIYDVNDGTTTYERIHIPSGEPYNIESFNFADDKITFVLVDAGRNGFGTGNYITNVSQFNIKTGKWKTIAEGCADAEFTADKNYVIITTAVIANYDEVESAYEYQYEYSTSKIKL